VTTAPPCVPLGEAIAHWAGLDPAAPALLGAGRRTTYGELAARAAERTPRPGIVVVEADDPYDLVLDVVTTASVSSAAVLGGHPGPVRAALRERLARFSPRGEERPPELDDPAIVFSTSGSTGAPKLVPNTHRNCWASAVIAADTLDLGRADRCFALGAMNHVLGQRAVGDTLWSGGAVIVPASLRVEVLAALLVEHRPTWAQGSPPAMDALAAALETLGADDREAVVTELRLLKAASAALRPAVVTRLRRSLTVPIIRGYAMTEVGKIATTRLGGHEPEESVGPPIGAEFRLDPVEGIDEDGVGEIVVRGDTVTPGYLDDAHRAATGFEADGWFHTGDIGRLDHDGNLFLLGRRDDLVSRGGEMVSLGMVEGTAEEHPAVAEALAAAVPHPSMGMDVVLGYVVEPGVEDPGVDPLRRFLDERLSTGQVPVRVVRLDEIPLTASRKPARQALADRFEAIVPHEGRNQGTEVELASLWAEVLGIEVPMDPWDDFFALGGSSLALVELADRIATTFAVDVAPGDLIGHPTLREMAGEIRPSDRRPRRTCLLPIREGEPGRLRLYLVPGRGGTLAALQRFVFHLTPGRPVLGFEAPGLYPGERPARSVRSQAARYADELVAEVGYGRFALVGSSFGSLVVQEMARRLERQGRPPELIVMIDAVRPRWRRWIRTRLARALRPTPARPEKVALGPRIQRTKEAAADAAGRHRPGVTRSPVVMVTSEARRSRAGDPLLGWRRELRGGVTTLEFPGNHTELIRDRGHETAPALEAVLVTYDPEARAPTLVP
jgi:oxalate---CoA ligase